MIEEELKKLNAQEHEEDIDFHKEEEEYHDDYEEEQMEEKEEDIIGQLEAVKKATEERNQNKLKELKKRYEANQATLEKNRVKIEKL